MINFVTLKMRLIPCQTSIMKILIRIMVLLLLFSACRDRIPTKKSIPGGIISKETMAKVLADIHIAESMAANEGKNDSAKMNINALYQVIFKKYNITREEYEKSMEFYMKYPDILAEIYENVTEILNTRKIE